MAIKAVPHYILVVKSGQETLLSNLQADALPKNSIEGDAVYSSLKNERKLVRKFHAGKWQAIN